MGEITFLDYDKITDTLLFLSNTLVLEFCVGLNRKNQKEELVPFHSEYIYKSNKKGRCIKRNISIYFSLTDKQNFKNSIMIRPQDICLLQMVMNNNIIPWVIGSKRIYSFDDNNKLIIKGKWKQVDFPLSDYKYISFAPIVVTYQDNTMKEGIRLTVNDKANYYDIDINKFMEFYYYICNTDMYSAGIGLLNYVKTPPYGINETNMNSFDSNPNYNDDWDDMKQQGKKNNFFDSL